MRLAGKVSDDGRPASGGLKARWEVLEAPGKVTFENEVDPATKATFARPGDYLLRLVGDDEELWLSDLLSVHVLPRGMTVAKVWEFNQQLNKLGWTEANLGTYERKEGSEAYQLSKPVKHVSGGYYVLAVENSPDAHLLSPDDLAVDLTKNKTIAIRFQNHTPATKIRLHFITEADPAWDDTKSQTFTVVANDNQPRKYTPDMSALAGWKGNLRQLRLDLAIGKPLTGTCRFDYTWIGSAAPHSCSPLRTKKSNKGGITCPIRRLQPNR